MHIEIAEIPLPHADDDAVRADKRNAPPPAARQAALDALEREFAELLSQNRA